MTAAALNNSGLKFYCPENFFRNLFSAQAALDNLFLNCFAAAAAREKTAADSEIDTTALLDIQDVKKSLDGDNEAYKRLIKRHQKKISAMMWRFSRNKVVHEELVQDVFVQVYMSLHTFRHKAPFRHWLYRVATRVGFTYWKKKARDNRIKTVSIEDFDQAKITSDENSGPDEVAEILHRLLEKLPPRDRLVLTLRYIQQHNIDETARLAGWSTSMVKVQTWRAKKKLKRLFEELQQPT